MQKRTKGLEPVPSALLLAVGTGRRVLAQLVRNGSVEAMGDIIEKNKEEQL